MALAASEVLASYSEKELELILDFLQRMRDMGLTQTARVVAMSERAVGRRKVNIKARVLGQKIRIRI